MKEIFVCLCIMNNNLQYNPCNVFSQLHASLHLHKCDQQQNETSKRRLLSSFLLLTLSSSFFSQNTVLSVNEFQKTYFDTILNNYIGSFISIKPIEFLNRI